MDCAAPSWLQVWPQPPHHQGQVLRPISTFFIQAIIAWISNVLKWRHVRLCDNKYVGAGVLGWGGWGGGSPVEPWWSHSRGYVITALQSLWLNPEYIRFSLECHTFRKLELWTCKQFECQTLLRNVFDICKKKKKNHQVRGCDETSWNLYPHNYRPVIFRLKNQVSIH